jgi:hypothetical protein
VIKKVVLYFVVFFLSLLVSLLILLPANIVWDKFLSSQLNTKQLGIDVQKVVGTIWNGQALISYKRLSGIIHWQVDLSEIWMLSLPMAISVNSQVGELDAAIKLSPSSVQAEIKKAQVDLKPLSPVFKSERVTLDGELFVKNMSVMIENKQVKSASGMASWSGGEISYPAGREVHQRNLPMFNAVVETKDTGEIFLSIKDSQASFDVIDANLSVDGTAMLRITRRLLDLSDEPWSMNSKEQDVVFKVKKMLY